MQVILSNAGDESIALIQWAKEAELDNVHVVTIETGWAAPSWEARVERTERFVRACGFEWVRLESTVDFTTLIREQGKFATRQFQWCANFLKALPLLDWLDTVDPMGNATVLLARRVVASRANFDLAEHIDAEEKLGDRPVWHPLINHSHEDRDALIIRAGFTVLNHRSLECDPCVNSDATDVLRMDLSVIERTATLEKEMNGQFLDAELYHGEADLLTALPALQASDAKDKKPNAEIFDMGCGNAFGCGL